jgi:hypothetical protein
MELNCAETSSADLEIRNVIFTYQKVSGTTYEDGQRDCMSAANLVSDFRASNASRSTRRA